MSKKVKNRRKSQKKSINPLLMMFSGGILLIAAALFVALGNGNGGGNPDLAVDQEMIDYGDVKFNTEKSFAIKVTNAGDGTLRFKEEPYIEVREGC
jgi:hypothetical protein